MSEIKLTSEQALAVNRRSALLVSAAAGSGKTRVLTQRLMARITDPDDPRSIDEFLVITYTRAAAAELKSRIRDELSRLSSSEPLNRRLSRQVNLCSQAKIGTIHSFCSRVIRENAGLVGLSPDFGVGDEDRCQRLKEKALEKALDAAYERIDEDAGFAALVNTVGGGRDDSRLIRTVLELHEKMQSHLSPQKWAGKQISSMELTGINDISLTPWGRELMDSAENTASFWSGQLDSLLLRLNSTPDLAPLLKAYGESLSTTAQAFRDFLRALAQGWDKAREFLPIPFPRLKALRNFDNDTEKLAVTSLRDACKKASGKLAAIFDAPSEKLLEDLKATFPSMKALLDLTLEFDALYTAEKRRANLLDFADLEHYAARLLAEENGEPTELAKELSKGFCEVLVDEYQDVNGVQDLIFRCISDGGNKLFTVGDVKQSIYRFRLADPEIFLTHLSELKEAEDDSGTAPAKVFLRRNFRSDRRILSACNSVFSRLMSKELGEVTYDSDSALYSPDDAPPASGQARLYLLDDSSEEAGNQSEAIFIANKIKSMVEGGETVTVNGTARPMRYSDIAVLMRSPGTAGEDYREVFESMGLPLSSAGRGFFSAPEVVVLTSLLTVIDDPHRDVPLAAVLASPVFGFTSDELARMRAENRDCCLYDSLTAMAPEDEKCRQFLETLNELRALSRDIGLRELLSMIYDRLELFPLWSANQGMGSSQNLMLYTKLAGDFEANGFCGLPAFLSRLETMERLGHEPEQTGRAGEAVTIMSIHKSKGLEFPVVFLAGTGRKINKKDLLSPVLIHSRLGLGGKVCDTSRGIEYPSLAHRAIKDRLERELLSEEMRVLYVALTRAIERLYITCSLPRPEEALAKLSASMTTPPSPELLRSLPSLGHWLMAASIDNPDGPELEILPAPSIPREEETASPPPPAVPDPVELKRLRDILSFKYPYEYAASLPSKLTATSIPSEYDDPESLPLAPRERLFTLPRFDEKVHVLSGAEKGVATHTVLQFIDFARTGTPEDIEREISRISALGHLSPVQAQSVDRRALLNFFRSPTGQRVKEAVKVLREFRFSLLCPAAKFFPGAGDEKLMLQGVVDCCIEEDERLTVIDYKTDYVTPETLDSLSQSYRPQVEAYAYALERITGKPVERSILCFIRTGLTAEFLHETTSSKSSSTSVE